MNADEVAAWLHDVVDQARALERANQAERYARDEAALARIEQDRQVARYASVQALTALARGCTDVQVAGGFAYVASEAMGALVAGGPGSGWPPGPAVEAARRLAGQRQTGGA